MSQTTDIDTGLPADGRFDPIKWRKPQTFGAGAVRKLLNEIPVRKPDPVNFIRVHTDPELRLAVPIFEDYEKRRTYLIAPDLVEEFDTLAKMKIIYPTINRVGTLILWPVAEPTEGIENKWTTSAHRIAEEAMSQWVRITSNMSLKAYETVIPRSALPEPQWPKPMPTLQQMLAIAFKDYLIDSVKHPVIKQIRGEE